MNGSVFFLASTGFILAILSYVSGCVAMWAGKSQPSIISRFFWLVLSITNFLSYLSLDAGSGIYLALSGLLGSAAVFFLSLRFGHIEFKRSDILTIAGACVALLCYLFVPIKLITLTAGLLTHFISGIPTYKRTWQNPYTENLPFWLLFALASLCSFAGVILQEKNMIYPLYFFLFDAGMVLLIMIKRQRMAIAKQRQPPQSLVVDPSYANTSPLLDEAQRD